MSQSPEFKSPRLSLPYIAPAQAQKHVTHNEALRMVDSLLHISVIAQNVDAPPAEPEAGARYCLSTEPTGDWAGEGGKLAVFEDGAWVFYTPKTGWILWDMTESAVFVFTGTQWVNAVGAEPIMTQSPTFGINTAADDTNRLAVKSDAVLLSHDDVTPGNGDVRAVLNKAAVDKTASLVFQTDYSGRAEFGLSGDDNFSVKVSADGQSWQDAMVINAQSGAVEFPSTDVKQAEPILVNMLGDGGRFSGTPAASAIELSTYVKPDYFNSFNGSAVTEGPRFIHNNATYGGASDALDPIIDELISHLKSSSARRYGFEFYSLRVAAGSGTSASVTHNDESYYLSCIAPAVQLLPRFTHSYHIRVETGALFIGSVGTIYDNGLLLDDQSGLTLNNADGWHQISQHIERQARTSAGYLQNVYRIYALPGTVYHFAAPIMVPGALPLGQGEIYGLLPNLTIW